MSAAIFAMRLPVTVSPVIETIRTFGWPTSASPMSAPEPGQDVDDAGRQDLGQDLGEGQGASAASGPTA